MAFALAGARIFDGTIFRDGMAVVIEGKRISDVVPEATLSGSVRRVGLDGGILAPGFIDVQVNGGGGALMNDHPTVDVVRRIAEAHRRHGTVGLLPTVITDAASVTAAAIEAVRAARQSGIPGVLGIHVEGPFLDVQRKGAHEAKYIRPLTDADILHLAQAGCGILLLTLAPNRVSPQQIRTLVDSGILVSLGHSESSLEIVNAALAAGASGFTHLFNAMSQMTGREPGMVGAALSDVDSHIGIIADGFHVHEVSLKLAMAATSLDRFMLITDAMPSAAGGPDHFELQGRAVTRVQDRLVLDDGTLAGSNLTMDVALRYCVNVLGVDVGAALRMASTNPARFLGLHDQLGLIAPGALASLVHLDKDLNVMQTWIEGQ
jgi:N-acetylglucosamine-6-phosphate deacetylase